MTSRQLVVGNVLVASLIAVVACDGNPAAPASAPELAVSAARAAATLAVTSAAPDSATQDTTLDVTINGSGFVSGAIAAWALNGVEDPNQIRTNSTRYVNSRQMVANITISSTAAIGKWDIMVKSGPKTGIGTEMFAVKVRANVDTDPKILLEWENEVNVAPDGGPETVQPAGIQGDQRSVTGAVGATSQYQGGVCGVQAKVFWDYALSLGTGDLVIDPDSDYSNGMTAQCGARRTLRFFLSYSAAGPAGTATQIAAWTNANNVIGLSVGQSRSQALRFWYIGLRDCDRLDFDASFGAGTSNVRVTRLDDAAGVNGPPSRRWRVESEYPHRAMCTVAKGGSRIAKGTKYLPFAYTTTEILYSASSSR